MKKILFLFVAIQLSLSGIAFGQAKTYFHDRIDTTIFAVADTVGHGSNNYYATNTSPDFNVNHYENGLNVILFIKPGNSGPATLTLVTRTGTLSTRSIRKSPGAVLASGDIKDSCTMLFTYYNGHWRLGDMIPASSSSWMLTGNAGTVAATNFLGTTDAVDLVIRTNNTERLRISSAGVLSLGLASTNNGSLLFRNSTNANTLTINSGVTSASYALTLPTAQGAANSLLLNDGAGALSWNTGAGLFWSLTGNAGTVAGVNFIGTTDAQDVVFNRDNIEVMRLYSANNYVGIGTATPNNKIQVANLLQFNDATFSTHAGTGAGSGNTGNYCTFLGYGAGGTVNTGERNTFIGFGAGGASTSGTYNVAIGVGAGQFQTTPSYNTFVGTSCGQATTTGGYNTFYGMGTGISNTTGSFNDFFGVDCATDNTTGRGNTVFGGGGFHNSVSGDSCTGIGLDNLRYNYTGQYNIGIGSGASPVLIVPYDNLVGSFTVGELVNGQAGANAVVVAKTGSILYLGTNRSSNIVFANNDAITGQSSGATALVNGTRSNPDSVICIGVDAQALYNGQINIGQVFNGRRVASDSTQNWVRLTGNTTITGTLNVVSNISTQDSLNTREEASVIADDGSIDLASGASGWGQVFAYNSGTCDGVIAFRFNSDASVTEMAVADALNSAVADTDTKICVFDNGTSVRIRNRLGGTRTLKIVVHY